MASDSAIEDTLAEARDLLLGGMATRVLDDINNHIHAAVPNFVENYFPDTTSTQQSREWAQESTLSSPLDPNVLSAPFNKRALVEAIFERVRNLFQEDRNFIGRDDERIQILDFQGKPDIVLIRKDNKPIVFESSKQNASLWANVLVLGSIREQTPSTNYQQAFLQLCGQAQQVFHHQPHRRFLHAFSIFAFTLELIVFDRAGVVSSEPYDLRTDFAILLEALHNYATLSSEELGLRSFTQRDHEGLYISFSNLDPLKGISEPKRFNLDDEPIATPIDLITNAGALCYHARHHGSNAPSEEIVIKFAWDSHTQRRETDILQLANRRNVWGVSQLLAHHTNLESIASLRQSLSLSNNGKRKFPEETVQRPSLGEQMFDNDADKGLLSKELKNFSVDDNCLAARTIAADEIQHHPLGKDIRLICVATSPYGRPLSSFTSPQELLLAFRDAIKAHHSLYKTGHILHSDISRNNIVIPTSIPTESSPHGILIDLDEAIILDDDDEDPSPEDLTLTTTTSSNSNTQSKLIEIRGTRPFISPSLMLGSHPSPIHDLHSFFFTLLHIFVSPHSDQLPLQSKLQAWNQIIPWPELAEKKLTSIMDDGAWSEIVAEFAPSLQKFGDLANELRLLLFLESGNEDDLAEEEIEVIYEKMIASFDKSISLC